MGPLKGFKIVEIAGIGPGQFCGMLLADMGAQLIRIDRMSAADLGIAMPAKFNLMNRSRPTIAVDLKQKEGVELVLRLCEDADALFEGFRPGVMERLGLGPDVCLQRNERLIYGRMTGWGQSGPLADTAGHDTNYIALAGALYVSRYGGAVNCPTVRSSTMTSTAVTSTLSLALTSILTDELTSAEVGAVIITAGAARSTSVVTTIW